ncbi:MAG: PIN domain-containing protein [Bacteroidales bacterium]|nr:PIN domain-containing protein [Bacteroidales bacterium]
MKVFLDTNIVIDFLGQREGFYQKAAKVLSFLQQEKYKIICSSLTFSTAYYICKRGRTHQETINLLSCFAKLCSISVVDQKIIKSALDSNFKDFEDSIQYFSAKNAKADVIISRDKKGFENSKILVKTPDEVLQLDN